MKIKQEIYENEENCNYVNSEVCDLSNYLYVRVEFKISSETSKMYVHNDVPEEKQEEKKLEVVVNEAKSSAVPITVGHCRKECKATCAKSVWTVGFSESVNISNNLIYRHFINFKRKN